MKPQIIGLLLISLLSISIAACSDSDMNSSNSATSSEISDTPAPTSPSSAPLHTPSDSKAEIEKAPAPSENKNRYSVASEALKSVLQNKADFISTDEDSKKIDLNEFLTNKQIFETAFKVTHFSVVDMDGDEIPEVVLELTPSPGQNPEFFEVFHYRDGTVYGYIQVYRGFSNLKADGAFRFSSGVLYNGYGRLRFQSNASEMDIVGVRDTSSDGSAIYSIRNKSVTEEAFISFSNEEDGKEDVVWHEFSLKNMEAELSKPTSPRPSDKAAAAPSAPTKAAAVSPASTTAALLQESDNPIIGTFICPYFNDYNNGVAEVTQIGNNKYHLLVSRAYGFSHHIGEMESDFTLQNGKVEFADPAYKEVRLTFTENAIHIDYEGEHFGGFNAEPKGTFYLKNSGLDDVPFLTRLYDQLKLPETYRNGFSDVYTYAFGDKQFLLVRSQSSVDRSMIAVQSLVQYDPASQQFKVLGEVSGEAMNHELSKSLLSMGVEPGLVYEMLNKDYADRNIEVQMERFDNGGNSAITGHFKLTDEEAFYIATGVPNATGFQNNTRDEKNMGSIFIIEVHASDEKAVLLHFYEDVRNGEDDRHTATSAWLSVDRQTGRVTNTLFED